jgi:hypothetical protein
MRVRKCLKCPNPATVSLTVGGPIEVCAPCSMLHVRYTVADLCRRTEARTRLRSIRAADGEPDAEEIEAAAAETD